MSDGIVIALGIAFCAALAWLGTVALILWDRKNTRRQELVVLQEAWTDETEKYREGNVEKIKALEKRILAIEMAGRR